MPGAVTEAKNVVLGMLSEHDHLMETLFELDMLAVVAGGVDRILEHTTGTPAIIC